MQGTDATSKVPTRATPLVNAAAARLEVASQRLGDARFSRYRCIVLCPALRS
jgi:hypothetical protein